ncbi:hypothetical protein [Algoriphagus sp.]|uniref:hypothetical protein n=1 Tax=Algoriphagus sp. TaxID=1872435 RepID=UPI00263A265C|nr:hypothetical protein [Algoriphagus sp.]
MSAFQVFLLFFIPSVASSQQVSYNFQPDSSSLETLEVMQLFENYLASNPQHQEKNAYWNTEEQQNFKNYDFLASEFQPSLYMGFPVHVLSIKTHEDIYEIKAQFSYSQEDGSPYVLAIVNYMAQKENGVYKLVNALSINRQKWRCTTVGWVDFYYPPSHSFNQKKAEKLNDFIDQICSNFGIEPTPFEYYLADDFDEIQRLKGLDYYLGMGGSSKPRGKAGEHKVYCGGMGEYYPHEVFHVLIDKHFPNKHVWASEGIATLLGGSRGKSLDWHLKKTKSYLQKHPELNLNEMLTLTNLDSETAFHYVLGGLIARKFIEKGGWNLLTELMRSGKNDQDYYRSIEQHLGINQMELNEFLRKELEQVSEY